MSTTFEYKNAPEPEIIITPVGDHSGPYFEIDFELREDPGPEQFDAIGTAEVKVVVAMNHFDGEVMEKAEAAHDAIVELKRAMADARGITDEEARQNLMLGNLDELPEVERSSNKENSS